MDAISEEGDDLVSMVRANAREYVNHMTDLNQELARAWNAAERVKVSRDALRGGQRGVSLERLNMPQTSTP